MSLNVMIIDDEKDIHTYLEQIIDWDARGLKLVCKAEDSISAIELFNIYRPQIVFMDVCFPDVEGRTGLDLAREFHEIDKEVRVIVITGFADFDYAQQALSVGAIDLLLKPLQPEQVNKSLDKAISFFREKRQRRMSNSVLKGLLDENLDLLRERKVTDLLEHTEKSSEEQIFEQLKLLSLDVLNDYYTVISIQLKSQYDAAQTAESRLYPIIIKQMCEQAFKEHGYKYYVYLPDPSMMCCLISWPKERDNEHLEVLLNKLAGDIELCLQLGLKIGIGDTVTSLRDISHSALCARRCLLFAAYENNETVLNYKNYCNTLSADLDGVSVDTLIIRIEQDLFQLNHKEVISGLDMWFRKEHSPEKLQAFCNSYLLSLSKLALVHNIDIWNSDNFVSLIQKGCVTSKRQAKITIMSATDDLFSRINDKQHNESMQQNSVIALAKKYVQENLTNPDLGFDDVCAHIGITKIYFGRLFQKEEGVSFGTYINKERIWLAQRLLEQTNLRVSEVAGQVGFSNTKYFSVIFKSLTGRTPLDYRRAKRMSSADGEGEQEQHRGK